MKSIITAVAISAAVILPSTSWADRRHHHHHHDSYVSLGFSFGYPTRYYHDPFYYSVYDPYYTPIVVQEPIVYRPVTYVQAPDPQPVQVNAPANPQPMDTFTVNVPNSKGGYTAVVIKKSGKGFTGPQGEFYEEFPKVAQLQTMYGT